jgi:hypothetical protein
VRREKSEKEKREVQNERNELLTNPSGMEESTATTSNDLVKLSLIISVGREEWVVLFLEVEETASGCFLRIHFRVSSVVVDISCQPQAHGNVVFLL